MKNPADVVVALEGTTSRLEKEAIIQQAWDLQLLEFFVGTRLACDPLIPFHVKKNLPRQPVTSTVPLGNLSYHEFTSFAMQLHKRTITGNAARSGVETLAKGCSAHEWNNWYVRVLAKDLKAGVSEVTINKILQRNGEQAAKYVIPVFSCQLAEPVDDERRLLRGVKLCDTKFDGVRLLSVLDKKTGTVTQLTRNGRVNENFPHLAQALEKMIPQLKQSIVLDGEVISSRFQSLMRQLNRKNNVNTSDAALALFDVIPLEEFQKGRYDVAQRDRHLSLCELEPLIREATGGAAYVVPKLEIDLDTEEGMRKLMDFNRETLAMNLEGIMIKDPLAAYECERNRSWLKMKPLRSWDLTAVDVEQGTAGTKNANSLGAVVFEGEEDGKRIRVSVGTGWSDQDREAIWANPQLVLGHVGEVLGDCLTQAQNSDTWGIRFPRFDRWRDVNKGSKI